MHSIAACLPDVTLRRTASDLWSGVQARRHRRHVRSQLRSIL
jgi:O-succinylbenzoate synthase